jgi:hypothetical protein
MHTAHPSAPAIKPSRIDATTQTNNVQAAKPLEKVRFEPRSNGSGRRIDGQETLEMVKVLHIPNTVKIRRSDVCCWAHNRLKSFHPWANPPLPIQRPPILALPMAEDPRTD